MKICPIAAAIALQLASAGAFSAEIDSTHLPIMESHAARFGFTPVTVVLPQPHPDEARKNPASFATQTREKAAVVLQELGESVKLGARYISPLGSMDIWVTREGLDLLRKSTSATAVIIGPDWHHKTLLPKTDGSIEAINKLLESSSDVEVELTLNIDGASFDVDQRTGRATTLVSGEAQIQSARTIAASLLNGIGISSVSKGSQDTNKNLTLLRTDAAEKNGIITVKANRQGLFDLARRAEVRAIKPANYAENTAPSIDQAAVEEASRAGKVGVIIQLRTPYVGGKTTTASNKAQRATYEAMLANFLSPYKMLREIQLYPDVGAAGIVISSDDFKRMISSGDRRLQGIVGNKPQYKLSLAKSTLAMNLPPYWGAGATASDQTIAILDSGILKTHAMLQNAGGGSKVTTESCYQSDTTWDNQPYVSACINKQSTGVGDSPAGTPDAGRIFPQTTCQSNFGSGWESYCAHGTHVAAIAAGRPSSAMNPQLSGVAPGAQIASVTITTPGNGLHVFHEDYTKALTDLNNGLTAGSYPYTISMSLGDGLENQPDSLVGNVGPNHTPIAGGTNTFAALVNSLKQKNIPVVAAMGNQGDYFRMNEPASVPGVIKVGSVANNGAPHPTFGTALTIATLSNRVRPEYWPGEYILFAPGGEDQSAGVVSATPYPTGSTTNTMPIAGTSMATPHVAGYYALLKSYYPTYGIDDISTYIQTTFSVGFQIPTGQACGPQPGPSCNSPTSVRFVRLP